MVSSATMTPRLLLSLLYLISTARATYDDACATGPSFDGTCDAGETYDAGTSECYTDSCINPPVANPETTAAAGAAATTKPEGVQTTKGVEQVKTTPKTVTFAPGTCADTNSLCSTWKANGFCTSSGYTVEQKKAYCGNSCGLCNPPTKPPVVAACGDSNADCATWIRNGFCGNTAYTITQRKEYCGKSCGLCGSVVTPPKSSPPIAPSCSDANASCPTWVANGFCTSSGYTQAQKKDFCCKSCKLG